MKASVGKINIAEKFGCFSEHWRPKDIASLNGQEVKLVKVQGVFPWHVHEHEDEMFMVWRGTFRVEFRDHVVELHAGELVVVPHGIEHRTAADEEAEVIIFEPAATRNTGNVEDDEFTAPIGVSI
jgi:mannose-6-phosphate isomerase-like protein (cupin superfamily)